MSKQFNEDLKLARQAGISDEHFLKLYKLVNNRTMPKSEREEMTKK